MTQMKKHGETAGAMGPPRADWPSRLDSDKARIPFIVRVLQTKEGELYVLADKAGAAAGGRGSRTLWAAVMGPLDPGKPLKEQLEGLGPWMRVDQTREEMQKAMDSWNSKAEGAFVASVDLPDMLGNEAGVLAAIKSRDREALERLCPNPYIMKKTLSD